MKVAFVGWNIFQLRLYQPIVKKLLQLEKHDLLYVIEKKDDYPYDIDPLFLNNLDAEHRVLNSNDMTWLNDNVDIVVCQTLFKFIEEITLPKMIFIQYGLAKELYNYGLWRSLADMNFVCGEYSYRQLHWIGPTTVTGPSRNPSYVEKLILSDIYPINPDKPTLLYAPTWGGLDSYQGYKAKIIEATEDYNVLIKPHHNQVNLEFTADYSDACSAGVMIFDNDDYDILALMENVDVVLSDYSGAIFDAVLIDKPIILLHKENVSGIDRKIDNNSIEIKHSSSLATVVHNKNELEKALIDFSNSKLNVVDYGAIKKQLYWLDKDSIENISNEISRLAQDSDKINKIKIHKVVELMTRRELAALTNYKTKKGNNYYRNKLGQKLLDRLKISVYKSINKTLAAINRLYQIHFASLHTISGKGYPL